MFVPVKIGLFEELLSKEVGCACVQRYNSPLPVPKCRHPLPSRTYSRTDIYIFKTFYKYFIKNSIISWLFSRDILEKSLTSDSANLVNKCYMPQYWRHKLWLSCQIGTFPMNWQSDFAQDQLARAILARIWQGKLNRIGVFNFAFSEHLRTN